MNQWRALKLYITTRLSLEIQTIRAKGESIESSEFYDLSSKMKANEAILLSTLYNSFITEAQSEAKNYTLLDPLSAGNKIPQKRWVLSRLHRHFGDILRVTCRHFRYGTVLYHKDCDLLNAISAALGRNKELCSDASKQPGTINVLQVEESIEQTYAYNCGIETQIENVSTHLNPKDRKCGPSCTCKNTVQSQAQTCPDETDLLVTDLLEEDFEDVYVEESDDDLE